MARSDSGAVPRRPHHISSVAHLFLQEDPAASETEPAAPDCDVAVAAPGVSPISAFAAAGLALGSPHPATLYETPVLRWSARTFYPPDQQDAGINIGSPGPGPGQRWCHLGCLDQAGLAHLESLAATRSLVDLPLTGSGGLIWCLLAQEACHLGSSYILGRLTEQIRPGRLEILIFPDAWADAGRPGWLDEICRDRLQGHDSAWLRRCAELADLACGGIAVDIHEVSGVDNLTRSFAENGQGDSLWRRVALSMMAGGLEC